MTPCPSDEDFLQDADGALSGEATERQRAHVRECTRCHEREATLRALIADLAAPPGAGIDVRAHTRAVMDRLDRAPAPRARSRRGWALGGLGAAAACVAAYFVFRPPASVGTVQARGGFREASLARDVEVRPCAVGEGLRRLGPGAIIDGSTPLTAAFRNLGAAPAFLLLFSVDAQGVVHWIAPRYTTASEDPIAVTIPVTADEEVLGTTAVLDDVTPGPLRVVALISPAPTHVSQVESLEGNAIDAAHLAPRLPAGTQIRETLVVVRGAEGGTR